ncbi:hypothetical protein FIBSPDRAFT_835858 [Athelia psychrophila]|uniref:Rhodopsin domain-containing protein n=1 Tax=Athelia psychrophila TaxID=1759441 RepID=A0A166BNA2_9AGAM|nr:hypothetical protein FIBSPDRAFT_835858 [Fibularhizoctonia sp. CBS 109695]
MILDVRTPLEHIPQPSISTSQGVYRNAEHRKHHYRGTDISLALVTIFNALAIAITAFRLFIQCRRNQLWWEDAWAGIATVFAVITIPAFWFRTGSAKPYADTNSKVITWWLVTLACTCVLWAARMSLIFSIIRLSDPSYPLRKPANMTAGFFACCWIGLVLLKVLLCRDTNAWRETAIVACNLGESVAIIELCVDVVADALLVALVLFLLRDARRLKQSQRKLIFAMFSATVLTTLVSIVHVVFVVGPWEPRLEGMTAIVKSAVSLIVCNLPVVVHFFYRRVKQGQAEGRESYDYAGHIASGRRRHNLPVVLAFFYRMFWRGRAEDTETEEAYGYAPHSTSGMALTNTNDMHDTGPVYPSDLLETFDSTEPSTLHGLRQSSFAGGAGELISTAGASAVLSARRSSVPQLD